MSDEPVHPVDSHGNQAAQPSAPSAADATRAVSGTLHIPLAALAKGMVAIPGLMRKGLEHDYKRNLY